jgi:hypothetical protein
LAEPLGAWAAGNGLKAFDVVAADDAFGAESAAAFIEGLGTAGGAATVQSVIQPSTGWSKVVAGIAAQPTKNVFAAFAGGDAVSFIKAWDEAASVVFLFSLAERLESYSLTRARRAIEVRVVSVFEGWGYDEIVPPLFDDAATFDPSLASKLYTFTGREGTTLALRHDFTSLVAKIAAGRLRQIEAPLRLTTRARWCATSRRARGGRANSIRWASSSWVEAVRRRT